MKQRIKWFKKNRDLFMRENVRFSEIPAVHCYSLVKKKSSKIISVFGKFLFNIIGQQQQTQQRFRE